MKERYNLYYLFLEDKEKHPLPIQQSEAIRKNIEKIFEKINEETVMYDFGTDYGDEPVRLWK